MTKPSKRKGRGQPSPHTAEEVAAARKENPRATCCYEWAFRVVVQLGLPDGPELPGNATNVHLVHGVPRLAVEPYCKYGHAWVEYGIPLAEEGTPQAAQAKAMGLEPGLTITMAYDAVTQHHLPRVLYYIVGEVETGERLVRYTPATAWDLAAEHESFGPWDEVFDADDLHWNQY